MAAGMARAQHQFNGTSLSEALIALDHASKHYDISFLYDELEDFTVTKTIRRNCPLPEAVREVCGFYPVRVTVKGRDILVECIQKDRTKLIGRLTDMGHQPIAYANIVLFSPSDSIVLGGGVSNEAGDFVIPCSAREARVRISCVGFRTLESTLPIGNVGTLRMQVANNYLGAVTVSGQVPVVHNETDRLTYVVRHDQFAKELTALELLNRVPMVSVTGGSASILGKGETHFMLNGRIVEQGGETIRQKLWSMRAEDIERIEVISVPSGRYQTEAGGFINIVLNPAQAEGWRADVSGQGVMNDNWSNELRKSGYSEQLNASLSYASRKLDFSLDLHQNWLAKASQTTADYSNIDYGNTLFDKKDRLRTDNIDDNIGVDAMLRYRPWKQLELGIMLSGQMQQLKTQCMDEFGVFSGSRPLRNDSAVFSYSALEPFSPARSLSLTAYTDWKLDTHGKKLSLSYNFFHRTSDDGVTGNTGNSDKIYVTDSKYNIAANFFDSGAETRYHLHNVKLDLSLPFPFLNIDMGIAYTGIKSPSWNKNNYAAYYQEDGIWLTDYSTRGMSDFDYHEQTAAAYLTAQRSFLSDRLSAKLGLRFERTRLEGTDYVYSMYYANEGPRVSKREENNRSYNEVLPTLHLNYRLAGHQQLSLAYGVGITRPNLRDLNPLQFFTNSETFISGNPSLFHGKTYSLEASYSNGHGLYATAYHHKGENQVEWITEFADYYSVRSDAIPFPQQKTYPINSTDYKRTGISLHYQHRFSPLLSATAEAEDYYYDAVAPFATTHGWGGRLGLSGDLFLNQRHSWMVSARYDHWLKDYKGITRYDGYGYFSMALRCSLMCDRLKLSLVATDPFHQYVTDGYRSIGSDVGALIDKKMFDEHVHVNHHISSVSLTASYSLFNHTKVNYTR